jgi:CBS domain-containing protein
MTADADAFLDAFAERPPFALLPPAALEEAAAYVTRLRRPAGAAVYRRGDPAEGLFLVASGVVELTGPGGEALERLRPGDAFGARAALCGGRALSDALATEPAELFLLESESFRALLAAHPAFSRWFSPPPETAPDAAAAPDQLLAARIADLMTREPFHVAPDATAREAAVLIRDRDVSCLMVCEGDRLVGLLTSGDLADRILAEGRPAETPVAEAMTREPFALGPQALGFDALAAMTERGFNHLPVVEGGRLVGVLTSTDLARRQAVSAVYMVSELAAARSREAFAEIVGRTPRLLVQLVGAGVAAHDVGRIVTSVADALTRRLLTLAEAELGPAPVPWCWAACGSQGRREQTAASDQDNCLILSDDYDEPAHAAYFARLASFVSDGMASAGYAYCPGEMMATNPRWRRPVRVWRGYFERWTRQPTEEARMLASVMFDLRPIGGDAALFEPLQRAALEGARRNSIFRAHMTGAALKHQPPLGLFRGMALIRSGEHKDRIDMKHSGAAPVVDLARLYALGGGLTEANTRERLRAAREAKLLSRAGADDLIAAFDLISGLRLQHQARRIREGAEPDNYLDPARLSELDRNHLREAFLVVKTMQSAAANRHALGA